jgi:Uma2 family endonuclease
MTTHIAYPETPTVVIRADHIIGPTQGQWSASDSRLFPDDGHRYEILDGVLYMAPPPTPEHQDVVGLIHYHLTTHVRLTGLGRVYIAPIGVELAANKVVEPDIVVILHDNLGIVQPKRIQGVPNLVVEVASPSTAGYDRREKQDTYAAAGVAEYWVVDPAAHTIEVLTLAGNSYTSLGIFEGDTLLPSKVVPGLPVAVKQFFSV